MYFHVHKQRNTVLGAVFHTRQINHKLQKLFVCPGAELSQEKGSPVQEDFFWQYLKEQQPTISEYLGWQHQHEQTMLYVSKRCHVQP